MHGMTKKQAKKYTEAGVLLPCSSCKRVVTHDSTTPCRVCRLAVCNACLSLGPECMMCQQRPHYRAKMEG